MQEEFEDGEKHCSGFLLDYLFNQTLIFAVPIAIVSINILVRTVLKYLAMFERQWNLTEQKLDQLRNMSILTVVNTCFVILIVS